MIKNTYTDLRECFALLGHQGSKWPWASCGLDGFSAFDPWILSILLHAVNSVLGQRAAPKASYTSKSLTSGGNLGFCQFLLSDILQLPPPREAAVVFELPICWKAPHCSCLAPACPLEETTCNKQGTYTPARPGTQLAAWHGRLSLMLWLFPTGP